MEEVKDQVTPIDTPAQEQAVETSSDESIQQINWRRFREQREIDRKAKEEAEKRVKQKEEEAAALKAAMESLLNKPNRQEAPQQFEDQTEEERIDKKVNEALAKRDAQYARERQAEEQKFLPQKLKQTYSDFDKVCTSENLDYLEFHYPEVTAPYAHMPDSFDKWSNIYKAAKRFIPDTNTKNVERRMEKNLSKPQSMSVPGVAGTGDHAPTHSMDEARKQANWLRMKQIMASGN